MDQYLNHVLILTCAFINLLELKLESRFFMLCEIYERFFCPTCKKYLLNKKENHNFKSFDAADGRKSLQ